MTHRAFGTATSTSSLHAVALKQNERARKRRVNKSGGNFRRNKYSPPPTAPVGEYYRFVDVGVERISKFKGVRRRGPRIDLHV